jgi:hypothetical protein
MATKRVERQREKEERGEKVYTHIKGQNEKIKRKEQNISIWHH